MITRLLQKQLESKIGGRKILIVLGPRQVGKTTLLKQIIRKVEQEKGTRILYWNCDEPDIRALLTHVTSSRLKMLVGKSNLIVIDEAQRVQDIGITLKLMHDNIEGIQIAVTGSSSLDLSSSINEPLTGRAFEYSLFPFSTQEMIDATSRLEETRKLETRLIYGMYPDVVNNPSEENEILRNITSSYLYKDIFEFQDIRKPMVIEKLLQALALQVGNEVSFNELSGLLGIDSITVQRYIDLLEKAFVIFHLRSYSKNVRNELKKSIKIYFYDNGIRNSILNNFSPVSLRTDKGALWENFLVSERMKRNAYSIDYANMYFWRTTQKQEIDYIEEKNGRLHAWEFKYNPKRGNAKCPLTFSSNYPDSTFEVITPENYIDFLI